MAAIQFLDMFMVFYVRGNYSVVLVQNISECYCCKELEPCVQSLESAGDWSEQAAFLVAIASLIAWENTSVADKENLKIKRQKVERCNNQWLTMRISRFESFSVASSFPDLWIVEDTQPPNSFLHCGATSVGVTR